MHLDPEAASRADEARLQEQNTRLFPLMRLAGFQLLLFGVVVHNVAVFGEVRWGPVLGWALLAELYCGLSWLVLRRWFGPMVVGDWDLSDLMFVMDLVLWVGAIYVTGAHESLLFFLVLLRVADHQVSPKAMAFALLGPVLYAAMVLWVGLVEGRPLSVPVEATKVLFLLAAGLYVEYSGRPTKQLQRQRKAALDTASSLLAQLRTRTTRLDGTNRARSRIRSRLDTGVRPMLVDIIGFSVSLLRARQDAGGAERRYLQRIHDQGAEALRTVESLIAGDDTLPGPTASLNRVLLRTATRESELAEPRAEQPAMPADVEVPAVDVVVPLDEEALGAALLQLMSAARHLSGSPARVGVRMDAATHLPEAVEVRSLGPPRLPDRLAALFEPFSADTAGNLDEVGMRMGLSEARSLLSLMGCELQAEREAGDLVLLVKLR